MINKRNRNYHMLRSGSLVEVIEAPDQGIYTKILIGKVGLIVENAKAASSPNVWIVLIENKMYNLHALDLKVIG